MSVIVNATVLTQETIAGHLERYFWKHAPHLETHEQCTEAAELVAEWLERVGKNGYLDHDPVLFPER